MKINLLAALVRKIGTPVGAGETVGLKEQIITVYFGNIIGRVSCWRTITVSMEEVFKMSFLIRYFLDYRTQPIGFSK